ncbi:cation:proton antiporter [Paraconexibacter algicola]|uniref:Cation/H+ exchanger transmembrane domain-containing protein n=1 Tax=Paraconexibacter algicola TaxID=2133960 RepID=A0A2T4UEA2_9ACTN|nr:cation:proton antiporter [Paraconexibacter algicola]PTL56116.1 hypothetical protein C7Y72_14070 [Paraconexibacter algicola]
MPFAAERGFAFADPYALVLLLGGLALLAAVVALTQEQEHAFTAAVVYLVLGVAIAALLAGVGIEAIDPLADPRLIEHLAELAVIIALFTAGLKLDRALSWREWRTPTLLLVVVMPACIAAVALLGTQLLGLSAGAAILLGAILAPTDPVLAGDVQVGPPGEEREREPHFALTAEAGLNDGLAFPFVFLGLFVAARDGGDWVGTWVLADVLYAIGVGVLAGAAGGRLFASVAMRLRRRETIHVRFDGWLAVAAVLAIYGATEMLGAYGFLAAFVAGLAFRRAEREHELHARVHEGGEVVEHVAELALVLLLGSTLTLAGLQAPGVGGWVLVVALLVLVRPAACLLAFVPAGLPVREAAFIGWFGMRGIGSLYYVAVAIGAGVLSDGEEELLYWTTSACIMTSILVHGLTSTRLTARLAGTA